MHSSRKRTARSSSRGGWGGLDQIPLKFPLGCGPDPPQLPLGCGPGPDPLNFPLGCGPGPDPTQLPPWVWAWTWSPSTSPLDVGLETSPQPDSPKLPPWDWAWKPARHAGIPPPHPQSHLIIYSHLIPRRQNRLSLLNSESLILSSTPWLHVVFWNITKTYWQVFDCPDISVLLQFRW